MRHNQLNFNDNLSLYLFRVASTLLLIVAASIAAVAADGDLDTSFDGDGRVATDFQMDEDVATESLLLPDGKILALGLAVVPGGPFNALARYNTDGSLDATFGTGGKLLINDSTSADPIDQITAVRLLPDGKIVGSTSDGYLVRLNPNGSLDATLSSGSASIPNGIRRVRIGGASFVFNDMVAQPDGKYVFATSTFGGGNPNFPFRFAVVRANADGTPDTSFGSGGLLTTNAPSGNAEAVELSTDNKIVVAGFSYDTPNNQGITAAVLRYNSDGTPDATFSGDGKAFSDRQYVNSNTTRLAVFSDGRIAVAQNFRDPNFFRFYISKFNVDGTPDTAFGANGAVDSIASFSGISYMYKILFQPDGKLIVFGQAQPGPNNSNYGFLVARYTLSGALDPTFGTNGFRVIQFAYPGGANTVVAISQANSGLLQADGKIVAVGHADFNSANGVKNFALVRINNSISQPTVNNPTLRIFDFDGDGRTDVSVFRNGTWFVNPSGAPSLTDAPAAAFGVQFGQAGDVTVPADYDGDGKSDIAVWRAGAFANFYILNSSNNTFRAEQFGTAGDNPTVSGDWDADGKADLAVYRGAAQSFFYYRPSSQAGVNFIPVQWGTAGDTPVFGDFDGDRRLDAAIYRPANNTFYVRQSLNGAPLVRQWGNAATDAIFAGDFDGDGKSDFAVQRFSGAEAGTWYVSQGGGTNRAIVWGLGSDTPVPADYDGDGRTDVAVFRRSNRTWYILQSSTNTPQFSVFGVGTDFPLPLNLVR